MGYPIEMIDKETSLYAFVGVNAIEENNAEIFNYYLKSADFNAKVMPLNIREDDIGFFIYGFKDSQIKAGYFSPEYWETLHHLLEEMSDEAKVCGLCDTITVVNKQNLGQLYYGKAVVALLNKINPIKESSIAIYGNAPTSKSILYQLVKKSPKEIILADMHIENTLDMSTLIPNGITVDIQRTETHNLKADIIIDSTDRSIKISNTVLNYTDILKKIAEIKTKEWMN